MTSTGEVVSSRESHYLVTLIRHLCSSPSDAVVNFWCENLRRFAENQPLLGMVDRRAGY